jgi:hypothetical protein
MVLPSAVAAILVAGLAAAGCGSTVRPIAGARREPRATPRATAPVKSPRPPSRARAPALRPSDGVDPEPHATSSQLSSARGVATAFLRSYVSYLSGRAPAARIPGVAAALRDQVERGRARVTPAERASHARIARLSLISAGPPISVVATAIIDTGSRQLSRVTATLEPHERGWIVVAVSG